MMTSILILMMIAVAGSIIYSLNGGGMGDGGGAYRSNVRVSRVIFFLFLEWGGGGGDAIFLVCCGLFHVVFVFRLS